MIFSGNSKGRHLFVVVGLVFAAALLIAPARAAKAEVISKLEAYTVLVDKDGKERFQKTDRVTPGGVIEYRISYENKTAAALNNFIVNGDVPASTQFVADTEDLNQGGIFEAEIADLGWQAVPAYREVKDNEGRIQKEEVTPSEYLSVRWRVTNPVVPGRVVQATYRIQVDQ